MVNFSYYIIHFFKVYQWVIFPEKIPSFFEYLPKFIWKGALWIRVYPN